MNSASIWPRSFEVHASTYRPSHAPAAARRSTIAPPSYRVEGTSPAARRSIRSAAFIVPGSGWSRSEMARNRARVLNRPGAVRSTRSAARAVQRYVSSRRPNPSSSHALRVVVLIPEQRKDDHRDARMEAFRDGVVPAMRQSRPSAVGQDPASVGRTPAPPHVRRQVEPVGLRPLVIRSAGTGSPPMMATQALHQLPRPPSRASRAKRYKQRAGSPSDPARNPARPFERVVGLTDARIEAVPRRRRVAPART